MSDSIFSQPKNDHINLIQINIETSEDTRDSFLENTKKKSKKIANDKKEKKIRNKYLAKKKVSKDFLAKNKIIQKIFYDFKQSSLYYKEFSNFSKIEKNIKNNLYNNYTELAHEIRNIFSQYFFNYSYDSDKYNKILILNDNFEKIYKEFDDKIFIKESKNLIDIKKTLNKLKKELREASLNNNSFVNFNSFKKA